jgi:hypothetical protein
MAAVNDNGGGRHISRASPELPPPASFYLNAALQGQAVWLPSLVTHAMFRT